LRDVALELRVRRREGVLARLARLADVEQVALLRGLRGRLDRGEARVADRRRREAALEPRVVRGRLVERGLERRLGPVVGLVAGRRVDPERDPVLEAVVDDRGDE